MSTDTTHRPYVLRTTGASKEKSPPPPASELLLVDEARLHVDDVAVRLRDLPHLLDLLLRFNRAVLEVGPAVVSAAPCKAAHPSQREDRFPSHRRHDIFVQMPRHLVVDLPSKLELRHPPRILDPYAGNLWMKLW